MIFEQNLQKVRISLVDIPEIRAFLAEKTVQSLSEEADRDCAEENLAGRQS